MKRLVFIVFVMVVSAVVSRAENPIVDSSEHNAFVDVDVDGIDDRLNEIDKRIVDSLKRDKDYWKKALLKGKSVAGNFIIRII